MAVGIIDAHCGAIGLGISRNTLALITGTSSCHMLVSENPIFVPGVWGPYFGAQLPNEWLSEGGQSATGALLEHTIERFGLIKQDGKLSHVTDGKSINQVYSELNEHLKAHVKTLLCEAAGGVHVLPEHHGNRSPHADPDAKGTVDGLTLDMSYEFLSKIYLATVQAVAYGTRHIVESMESAGHKVSKIAVCGGGAKNEVWLQEHADALQRPLVLAEEPETVLLGAAVLAAVPCKYATVQDAIKEMCRSVVLEEPRHC